MCVCVREEGFESYRCQKIDSNFYKKEKRKDTFLHTSCLQCLKTQNIHILKKNINNISTTAQCNNKVT